MLQLMQTIAQDDAKFAKAMICLGLAFATALVTAMTIVTTL
jgi:hypothetical protein